MSYLWWKMIDQIAHIILEFVDKYGFWGIFLLMLSENVGLPVPTEIGFFVGQAMVASGRANYFEIFLVVLIGKTLGSIPSYFAGRYFADRIKMIERSSRLKKAQAVFSNWNIKYGSFAVFISRLVGYIRPWSSYLAGLGEIKFSLFIIYNILGSAIIIILSMLVYGFVVEILRTSPNSRPYAVPILIFFSLGFWIILYIYQKIKAKKKS
jgi:membrane-associated protein